MEDRRLAERRQFSPTDFDRLDEDQQRLSAGHRQTQADIGNLRDEISAIAVRTGARLDKHEAALERNTALTEATAAGVKELVDFWSGTKIVFRWGGIVATGSAKVAGALASVGVLGALVMGGWGHLKTWATTFFK